MRVISDMVKPNGMVGTPDGKTLYVADHGAGKTWKYEIGEDGALSGKTLFAGRGSDGMTMDSRGNVYLVGEAIFIYSPSGKEIGKIDVPVRPTNLCFYGSGEKQKLFITARTHVFSIRTDVRGAAK
jgi:gluconolactonase